MPIRFHCDDCHAKIKVPEGAQGRPAKCPRCGAVHRVPDQSVTEPNSVEPDTSDLSDAFSETQENLDSLASAMNDLSIGQTPSDQTPSDQAIESVNENVLDNKEDNKEDKNEDNDEDNDEDGDELGESPLEGRGQEGLDDDQIATQDEVENDDEENEEDEHDSDDPLAALASLAQESESPDSDLSQDRPLDQSNDESLLDNSPSPSQPASQPSEPVRGIAMARPSSAVPVGIPLARPKPHPTAKHPGPSITEDSVPSISSQPQGSSGPPSPQPKAIALSGHRPRSTPIPIDGSSSPSLADRLPPARLLLALGWLLRVLAFLALGGAVKLLLVAIDYAWPFMDCLLVLLYGLIVTVVVWTLAEITLIIQATMGNRNAVKD